MSPHYERVFSPDGEPFDVSRDRVADLVLNKGWTRSPTVDAEPIEPRVVVSKKYRSAFDAERPVESRGETTAHAEPQTEDGTK